MVERGVSPQMVGWPMTSLQPRLTVVQERFVCMSLLKLASGMPISNKAALVVALGNGSPVVRRISRWLSTALIIEGTMIPEVSSVSHQRWRSTLMISG
jgi:hypothetical protein